MIIWRCVNDWWVLNMMLIIIWFIFSFVWIVRNCMKLLICGDVVDIDVNMLNVDCWWRIYICLMLILDMVIVCIELCCWILICKFYGDSCGACMYEMCLFWWWIMLLNYYIETMVILLVNAYFQNEGEIGYYIQWWWVVVVNVGTKGISQNHLLSFHNNKVLKNLEVQDPKSKYYS